MNIMVTNRDGELEYLNLKKVQKKTQKVVHGLKFVSSEELEMDAHIQLYNGVKTAEIQKTLVLCAVQKIDIDRPDWTFVAARLLVEDLYHKVGKTLNGEKGNPYPHLSKYFEYGEKTKLNRTFFKKYSFEEIEILNDYIQAGIKDINGEKYHERDYLFNYLGMKTAIDRYLLKGPSKEVFELPQHMFMSLAMFLAQREENKLEWAIKFYDMVSKFEVMMATPTLSNGRTERNQLSSCYVNSNADNIESIFDIYKENALLSKYGGGIGTDYQAIRSIGGDIDGNKGVSGGKIPFLKITNDEAIAVDQLGTRKGSIATYIEPWDIDVLDFIDLKKNSGEERRRTHDLFPALWVNDLFMERVEADSFWTLFDSGDVPDLHNIYGDEFKDAYLAYESRSDLRTETINAKELWKRILLNYFETAAPFICFKDSANKRHLNENGGIIRSSNLCTEIFQFTNPDTYGIKLYFDDDTYMIIDENEELNIFEDIDVSYKKKAKKVNSIDTVLIEGEMKNVIFSERIITKIGDTAVCNLASVNLSKINTKEDFERIIPVAIRALDNVVDLNYYPVKKAMLTNKKTRGIGLGVMGEAQFLAESKIYFGSQQHLEVIDSLMEEFSYQTILASSNLAVERGSYPIFNGSDWAKGILPIDSINKEVFDLNPFKLDDRWEALREKIKKDGMRNGYLMAIAPTSTISILTGTTQAIEPVFKKKWFEENLSGLTPVVVPNLSPETWEYYTSAYDLNQLDLIKAAAIRQKWIDQGQSLNIFMRLDKVNGKYLNDIYFLAWKLGLKSTYYLRGESPEAVEEVAVDRSIECSGCQ